MVASRVSSASVISVGFHALSDPIRLQVLALLDGQELCVCDLCEKLAIAQSKLSFHLKRLKEADLVLTRQEGRWIYYRLNPEQFAQLQTYLSRYSQAIAEGKHDGRITNNPNCVP